MMKKTLNFRSRKGTIPALIALCSGVAALPASAIPLEPNNPVPPALSAPQSSSGSYDVSWNSGYSSIFLQESPTGTNTWSNVHSGSASPNSKSFNYVHSGIRYYRAKGCTSATECSEFGSAISVNISGTKAKPITSVVLGDSFMSGEGGRWRGNTNGGSYYGGLSGTDAAGYDFSTPPYPRLRLESVYEENSINNGCHRSFSAAIHQLNQPYFPMPPLMLNGPFQKTVNLACSGGRNKHLWPYEDEGVSFRGEAPQINQLAKLTLSHDIKLVVVGIGGNDLGFSDVVTSCMAAWFVKHWGGPVANYKGPGGGDWTADRCDQYVANEILPKLGDVYYNTAKSINLIRREMLRQGKTDPDDYRIVLMGAPAILAGFSDNRYSAGDRRNPGRCPFNGPDSQFIEQVLMPKLNGIYEALAHDESVDFINTKDVFEGHKLCQTNANRASSSADATAANMEWARFVDHELDTTSAIETIWHALQSSSGIISGDQGRIQESLHPNQFGQEAIGSCIRKWWQQRDSVPGPHKCTNPNPDSTQRVAIAKLPPPTFGQISTSGPIPNATLLGEAYPGGPDAYQPGELLRSKVFTEGRTELGNMARIELKIDHADRGDLKIFLRSPSGAEHHIRGAQPVYAGPFPSVSRNYLAFAAWEPGEWTLVMQDTRNPGGTGTFQDFKIWWF